MPACYGAFPYDDLSHDEASHNALSYGEIPHDDFSHDEASHDGLSYDEIPHDDFSHDEASHDALSSSYDFFYAPAASFPYDHNSRRGSVMQLTGVQDDSKVGRLLVRGNIKI